MAEVDGAKELDMAYLAGGQVRRDARKMRAQGHTSMAGGKKSESLQSRERESAHLLVMLYEGEGVEPLVA